MPFTLAHAAAALPFRRSRLVPSALVVGTMAPDFEYFLRLEPGGGFGHTILGAFLLSLPLALAVLWIFHVLLKKPLEQLFPDAVRLRIAAQATPFRLGGTARFALIVLSALVGIATHLLWDMFTHVGTWPYRRFAWFRQEVRVPVLGPTGHFGILQLVSTVAGMLILCAWFVHWYRTTAPACGDAAPGMPAWRRILVLAIIAVVACAGGMIRALMVMANPHQNHGWVTVGGAGVVAGVALAWWVLFLYAVFWQRRWSPMHA